MGLRLWGMGDAPVWPGRQGAPRPPHAGTTPDDRDEGVEVRAQPFPGGPQLESQRGVEDVRARKAEMKEAPLGPDALCELVDEGDDLVVGRPVQLSDAGDVDDGPAAGGPGG